MDTEDIEKAVEERRVWLRGRLEAAAPWFGVDLVGDVVNTYDMRSAGARAREGDHDVWLRVVVEDPDYQPACRWDGNVAANSIRGVPKPQVLRWADWTNTDSYLKGRRLRGEVMTLAPGSTIAPDNVLHDDPQLPESWWSDLDAALEALAALPVNRDNELGAVQYTVNGVQAHFDVELPSEMFADLEWTTAHADLHWGNLRGPQLCILDWESWRPALAGYDAATLYCNSLLHPPTAGACARGRCSTRAAGRSRSCSPSSDICGWLGRAVTSTSSTDRFVRKPPRSWLASVCPSTSPSGDRAATRRCTGRWRLELNVEDWSVDNRRDRRNCSASQRTASNST